MKYIWVVLLSSLAWGQGLPVRCPKGQTKVDGRCYLPVITNPSEFEGQGFDCRFDQHWRLPSWPVAQTLVCDSRGQHCEWKLDQNAGSFAVDLMNAPDIMPVIKQGSTSSITNPAEFERKGFDCRFDAGTDFYVYPQCGPWKTWTGGVCGIGIPLPGGVSVGEPIRYEYEPVDVPAISHPGVEWIPVWTCEKGSHRIFLEDVDGGKHCLKFSP